jgi:hypothetical protein
MSAIESSSVAAAGVAATPAASASASAGRVGLCGAEAAASLSAQDWALLGWQRQLKEQLPERPKQTGFRVYAILTYTPAPAFDEATTAAAASKYGPAITTPHPYDSHLYVEGTNKQLAYVTGTNTEPCFIGNVRASLARSCTP